MKVGDYMNNIILMGENKFQRTNTKNQWKIRTLRRTTNALVLDTGLFQEILKNRYGNKDMESCNQIQFETVNLSDLSDDEMQLLNIYHGKNVWLRVK